MADKTALDYLISIDYSLKVLASEAEKRIKANMAPAENLDGPFGNPIIKAKSPRDWAGADMTGKKLSECPPEYLDLCASRSEFFAAKNDDEGAKDDKGRPKSYWDRKNAALARGWAERIRSGAHVQEQPVVDDVPADW